MKLTKFQITILFFEHVRELRNYNTPFYNIFFLVCVFFFLLACECMIWARARTCGETKALGQARLIKLASACKSSKVH